MALSGPRSNGGDGGRGAPAGAAVGLAVVVVGVLAVALLFAVPAFAETTYPLVSQITGAGTPAGSFSSLQQASVAVDHADGRIYVANSISVNSHGGTPAVYELDSSGAYLSTWTGAGTPAGSFGDSHIEVAVNERTGDVYVSDPSGEAGVGLRVVDVFDSAGGYVCQITGAGYASSSPSECDRSASPVENPSIPEGSFSIAAPNGLAVDQATGEVYVVDQEDHVVDVFDEGGAYRRQLTGGGTPMGQFGELAGVAVDGAGGRVYVADSGDGLVYVFDTSGGYLEAWDGAGTPAGKFGEAEDLAVDGASGDVLVADRRGDVIDVFSSAGAYLGQFSDGLTFPGGIAVDQATEEIYVSNGEVTPTVDVFGATPKVLATTATGAASGVQPASATLGGTVDPSGVELTECKFEYIDASGYEPSASDPYRYLNGEGRLVEGRVVPCAQTPAQIGAGTGPVEVSADIAGLTKSTAYEYRLVTANANGLSIARQSERFVTAGPPSVTGSSVSQVASTSAVFDAQIDPDGLASAYRVQYGQGESYGQSTPAAEIPAGESAVGVSVSVAGLEPDTTYDFRFVAENSASATEGQPVYGPGLGFTTFPPSTGLPDGRVYELVTPLANHNVDVYAPAWGIVNKGEFDLGAALPFQVAASGNAVTYVGDPSPEGNGESGGGAFGNQYLATRTAAGWGQQDISPRGHDHTLYEAFSPELSTGILRAGDRERHVQLEGAPLLEEAPAGYEMLYTRDDQTGGERALFTSFEGAAPAPEAVTDRFAGGSEGFATVLFEASAALAPEAASGSGVSDLYETSGASGSSGGGVPRLVNVLPGGGVERDASFGAPDVTGAEGAPDYSHDISANGARVFWTGLKTHDLYMSEAGAEPVQLDLPNEEAGVSGGGGGQFWTASSDGGVVFFTDAKRLTGDSTAEPAKAGKPAEPDLYAYNTSAPAGQRLADLSVPVGGHADVLGVLGASEDGSYVYFVANGVLTTQANANGETARPGTCNPEQVEGGECNLYVSHRGTVGFVATLAGGDGREAAGISGGGIGEAGDWVQGLGHRTAEVTPSGGDLVFLSKQRLTGYDNEGRTSAGALDPIAEVYVYDAVSGGLVCASCNPSGEPVQLSQAFTDGEGEGMMLDPSYTPTRTTQWMSEDGDEVFFDSAVPLVPEDTNGLVDVYEWERGNTGTCRIAQGCLSLLSGGKSDDNSYLLDTSTNGEDVFFVTRAQLLAQDQNETFDVYDAHAGATTSPSPSLGSCPSTGCPVPPPPPVSFQLPASITFAGAGNLLAPAPAKPTVSARARSLTRAQKLAKALRACHTKRKRAARAKCEKQAKKRYGAKTKAKAKVEAKAKKSVRGRGQG